MRKILVLGGTGFVGKAIVDNLKDQNEIVVTSGHHEVEHGYICPVENPEKLLNILNTEKPDIVISSLDGNFDAQIIFHEELGKWVKIHDKKLVYVSTLNVFDNDLSKPVDENTEAVPGSAYGIFKLKCEKMLTNILGDSLVILRLAAVWAPDCPRIDQLREYSANGKELKTYFRLHYSVALANQIGEYVKYILDNNLSGIFHIGSEDMVNSHEFDLMVCDRLGIPYPKFKALDSDQPTYMGFLPSIREIPSRLRKTVADVLNAVCTPIKNYESHH